MAPPPDPAAAALEAVETVFRTERPRLVGGLLRLVRSLDLAEDLAQDALAAALVDWPRTGVPDRPGAWLMVTARRRAMDRFRRARMQARHHAVLAADREEAGTPAPETALDDEIGDEILTLIVTACHPMLAPEARAALTLRLVGGLTIAEIARAFLSTEAAIGQRITRAKRAIAEAGLAYDVPRGAARAERLGSVLEVLYLIFNEGYAATAGDALTRPDLCAEACRLARILAAAAPAEPEVFGLLALMEIQASRLAARLGPDGGLVPLPEQDRRRWDRQRIRRGLAALARAEALGGADGPYALQAALAACHARAASAAETDWPRIAALYDRLLAVMPSPVVALNRAIAHGMAFGAAAGLALLRDLEGDGALQGYAPLPAAIGDALFRLGRREEARQAFLRAAALTANRRERDFLSRRAGDCAARAR